MMYKEGLSISDDHDRFLKDFKRGDYKRSLLPEE
jgi:hypothetical protein